MFLYVIHKRFPFVDGELGIQFEVFTHSTYFAVQFVGLGSYNHCRIENRWSKAESSNTIAKSIVDITNQFQDVLLNNWAVNLLDVDWLSECREVATR